MIDSQRQCMEIEAYLRENESAHPPCEHVLLSRQVEQFNVAYGEGFVDGKGKALAEVRDRLASGWDHHPGCGCGPCLLVKAVLASAT